jgi:hypothetical protein
MTNIKMTREQFKRIQYFRDNLGKENTLDYWIDVLIKSGFGISQFLNTLSIEEFATAWIAPEKVEIIESEITWQEAIQHVLDGGEVKSFDVPKFEDRVLSLENFDNLFLGARVRAGKWRKVVSE